MTTQLQHPVTINAFCFAGNATFTLRSTKTGTRFTFKVQRAPKRSEDQDESTLPFFVKLLSGPNNEADFVFMGTIFPDSPDFLRASKKSRITKDAPSFVAFAWWLRHIGDERVEVWHEDTCGRCGRTLTVPESIATGLGPICAAKEGVDLQVLIGLEDKVRDNAPCTVLDEAKEYLEDKAESETTAGEYYGSTNHMEDY